MSYSNVEMPYDLRGLRCPLPVLKLGKKLNQLSVGQTLEVLSDDPLALIDVPLLCKKRGSLCSYEKYEDFIHFYITK